jgi:hypothetical protein
MRAILSAVGAEVGKGGQKRRHVFFPGHVFFSQGLRNYSCVPSIRYE